MKIAMCCVTDEKPKYRIQALRWARSIRLFGPPADLFIGLTDPLPAKFREEFEDLEVTLVPVRRASDWHGPSNKLGVLLDPRLRNYDFVLLSDCDIAVAADFRDELKPGRIRAKAADLATLGNNMLELLFCVAGQPVPDVWLRTSIDRVLLRPYCNSGLIVFSAELLRPFMARWLHWNNFMLDNTELLGTRAFFTDQVSFALALTEFLDHFEELPVDMNFPCHLERASYPPELHRLEPRMLHYHDRVDGEAGRLLRTGMPGPDRVIDRVNARMYGEAALGERRASGAFG